MKSRVRDVPERPSDVSRQFFATLFHRRRLSRRADRHVRVPGDKSISHRALLLGAIADGETRITGFGRSADTEATLAAVRALGVEVYEADEDTLRVFGAGLRGLQAAVRPDRLRERRHADAAAARGSSPASRGASS